MQRLKNKQASASAIKIKIASTYQEKVSIIIMDFITCLQTEICAIKHIEGRSDETPI
jgi:hypothetical protein